MNQEIISSPLSIAALKWGRHIAIESNQLSINYLELNYLVRLFSNQIEKNGVKPREIIPFLEPNSILLVIKVLACFRHGAIACLLNPALAAQDLNNLIKTLPKSSFLKWEDLDLKLEKEKHLKSTYIETEQWNLKDYATIIFTSGSSGQPKGVLSSLKNHYYAAIGSNRFIPLVPGEAWHLSLPMYHVAGIAILFRCLLSGATLQLEANEKTTHVSWVNKQLADFVAKVEQSKNKVECLEKKPTYRHILLGGGPVNKELIKRVPRNICLYKSYGMTEMNSQIYTEVISTEANNSKGVLDYRQLRVSAEKEILVKGECLFEGYITRGANHNEIMLEKPLDKEGWFATKDIGNWDDKNKILEVIGRKDNMFISRGENIQPENIEKIICEISGVLNVVVVPQDHETYTNSIQAFIQLDPSVKLKNIISQYKKKLPKYLWPETIHAWPREMPNGAVKIKRDDFKNRIDLFNF